MYFSKETLGRISDLVDKHGEFFDALGQKDDSMPGELFDELADIFCHEFGLKLDNKGKMRFLLELGYMSRKSVEADAKQRVT